MAGTQLRSGKNEIRVDICLRKAHALNHDVVMSLEKMGFPYKLSEIKVVCLILGVVLLLIYQKI